MLATAVFGVVTFIVDRSGWKGLVLFQTNFTDYAAFLVIFFVGVLWVGTG